MGRGGGCEGDSSDVSFDLSWYIIYCCVRYGIQFLEFVFLLSVWSCYSDCRDCVYHTEGD